MSPAPQPDPTTGPVLDAGPAAAAREHPALLAALRAPHPRPTRAALGPLQVHETQVLRDAWLDRQVLADVAGVLVPVDVLCTPEQRARAIAPLVPRDAVVCTDAALWVHAGGPAPARLAVTCPSRTGSGPRVSVYRGAVPPSDVVTVAGVRCARPARAAADLARCAPPARAVEALLVAVRLGLYHHQLLIALSHCRGAAAAGRPRAERLVETLVPRAPRLQAAPGPAQP